MCTDLSLAAMNQVFHDEVPWAPVPDEVRIEKNSNITHWFNVTVDEKKIFVNIAIRRRHGFVSTSQRARVEAVLCKNAHVLRLLLSKTDSGNNILSIAMAGEDITIPEGISQGHVGEISSQPFSVCFAGKNLMEITKQEVHSFRQQIRQAIESE